MDVFCGCLCTKTNTQCGAGIQWRRRFAEGVCILLGTGRHLAAHTILFAFAWRLVWGEFFLSGRRDHLSPRPGRDRKGQKRMTHDRTGRACSYRQKKANLNPEHDNGCSWEKQTFQLCPISHDCGNILAKHKQKGNVNAFCCSWLADEEESDWLKCVWWSKFFQPAPNDERLFVFGLCCFNMMEQMCWLPAPTLMQQTQN